MHPCRARVALCPCLPPVPGKQGPGSLPPQATDSNVPKQGTAARYQNVSCGRPDPHCPILAVVHVTGPCTARGRAASAETTTALRAPPGRKYWLKVTVRQRQVGTGKKYTRTDVPAAVFSVPPHRLGGGLPGWGAMPRAGRGASVRAGTHLASGLSCSSGMMDSHAVRHWNNNNTRAPSISSEFQMSGSAS